MNYDSNSKYNPNWSSQPRKPAGSPHTGGQWINGGAIGGADKHPHVPRIRELRKTPNVETEKRARVIYGETSGLRPQLKNPKASPDDQKNWDEHSAELLHTARVYVGIVSTRNHVVHSAKPSNGRNPIEATIWSLAVDAAMDGSQSNLLDHRVTNFYLRRSEKPKTPDGWTNLRLYYSFGPFYAVGGGDAGRGPGLYIDFYGRK